MPGNAVLLPGVSRDMVDAAGPVEDYITQSSPGPSDQRIRLQQMRGRGRSLRCAVKQCAAVSRPGGGAGSSCSSNRSVAAPAGPEGEESRRREGEREGRRHQREGNSCSSRTHLLQTDPQVTTSCLPLPVRFQENEENGEPEVDEEEEDEVDEEDDGEGGCLDFLI